MLYFIKKSRIQETKHLSTDADSSTNTIGGWSKNPPKPNFFEIRKKSPKTQKLRNVQKYDKNSDTPFDQRFLIHREAWFPPCFVGQRKHQNQIFVKNGKNQPKRKNSKTSRDIPKLAIRPLAKRSLNGTFKNEHTAGQTDGQSDGPTDRRTFPLIESIGPEGRCFEKCFKILGLREDFKTHKICRMMKKQVSLQRYKTTNQSGSWDMSARSSSNRQFHNVEVRPGKGHFFYTSKV